MKDDLWKRFAEIVAETSGIPSSSAVATRKIGSAASKRDERYLELLQMRLFDEPLFRTVYEDIPLPERKNFWEWLYAVVETQEELTGQTLTFIREIIEELEDLSSDIPSPKKTLH